MTEDVRIREPREMEAERPKRVDWAAPLMNE